MKADYEESAAMKIADDFTASAAAEVTGHVYDTANDDDNGLDRLVFEANFIEEKIREADAMVALTRDKASVEATATVEAADRVYENWKRSDARDKLLRAADLEEADLKAAAPVEKCAQVSTSTHRKKTPRKPNRHI